MTFRILGKSKSTKNLKKYRFKIWSKSDMEVVVEASTRDEARAILDDEMRHDRVDLSGLGDSAGSGGTVYKGIVKEGE